MVNHMKRSPLFIVFLTVFIDLLGFGIMVPLAPYLAKEFGADGLTFGILMMAFSLMQFIFSPYWGRISDRVGRRPIILLSLAASTTGYVIFAMAQSLTWLFISRIIAGIGAANISTTQAVVADTMPPEKRTFGMAMIGMAIGFGFTFGPGIAGLCLWLNGGDYAPVFWLAAALSGFDMILAYFILPETLSKDGSSVIQEKRFSFERFKLALSLPVVSSLLISSLIFYTAFAMMEVMLGLFGDEAFGLTAGGYAAIMFSVGMLMAVVQGGMVYRISARIGDLNTLRIGMAGIVFGLFLLGFSTNITWMAVSTSILACFVGLTTPAMTSLVSQFSPSDIQGGMLGLNQSMASLGRILGPLIGGLCFDYIHIRAPFPVGGLLVMVVLVLLMRMKAPETVNAEPDAKV